MASTTTAIFTSREALNQFLDAQLESVASFNITVTIEIETKSYSERMPQWKATDILPILSKFELYDQVLKSSLALDTPSTYSRDIHGHILQSLILCHGFIPLMEFLRYRLFQETLQNNTKAIEILRDDVDTLFQKNVHWWKPYKAFLETQVPVPAPATPATPDAVKKYLAHNTFHLRNFGYHIGLSDDAIQEPLRRAVAAHGKDKVLCKLYYLLSVYTNERSASHKALQRDVTIVSTM
jgi:hypothetical protein